MQPIIKKVLVAALLVVGLQSVWAFSPGGPIGNGGDTYQSPVIGYGLGGDLVAPKNIGEEYRRNVPLYYYGYNANFLEYFGTDGAVAVDAAFGIMNGLTNVSSYSSSLNEFPMNSQSFNYTAQALGLTDLKSVTLSLLAEQMGLAEPDRYTWTLHDRYLPPGGKCPIDELYLVVQRNLDPVISPLNQIQYSSYVNGTLYSYLIFEFCTGPNPLAQAVPFPVDPFNQTYTAVASIGFETGGFYGGLTRDDVGGLRYLLRTNNINFESAPNGSLLTTATTNLNAQQLFPGNTNGGFGTLDLNLLLNTARTNDPATLAALYPNLIISSFTNYFILATNINVVAYFTNYNGEPYTTPPHQVNVTNYTYYPLAIYSYTFANIVTNNYSSNTVAKLVTTKVSPLNGAAIGSPAKTNITTKTVTLTNVPSGDYYLLSPDQCPVNILYTLQTNVFATTNIIVGSGTNGVNTNSTAYSYSQSLVTYFTNHIYVVHPVTCTQVAGAAGLYQGIENIKFVRANYDSLLTQFFQPITNNYTMTTVVNSQTVKQKFQRIITAPDFLMSAQDLAGGPGGIPVVPYAARNVNFNQANILPGLAGPGTIVTPTTFTFNKVGDIFGNGSLALNLLATNGFLSEFTQVQLLAWGSFDGSTNIPIVYPNGTSIENLANQILVQIAPTSLPNGSVGLQYLPQTFTASGGSFSSPFTWSQTGLPDGLTLSADGTLSGTPTQAGTFDFTIQLTDSLSRTVQWSYSIIIQ